MKRCKKIPILTILKEAFYSKSGSMPVIPSLNLFPFSFQSWNFRYGAKHLVPHKLAEEGIPANVSFTMLALEDTASRSQKCFAGCETGVAVFNLYEGILLSYKRDLHVRSITG